jgi:hypothetical protein
MARPYALPLAVLAVLLLVLPQSGVQASEEEAILELHGAYSRAFVLQLAAPVVLDLTGNAEGLPAAVVVEGGHGFVGFALTELHRVDGVAAIGLRLPEPYRLDGAEQTGFGWGRNAAGEPCVRCTVPAGTYRLHLINDGFAGVEATVRVTLEGAGEMPPMKPDPAFSRQHGIPALEGPGTDAPTPVQGGGMWSWTRAGFQRVGLHIDLMTARSAARVLPAHATVTTFCRDVPPLDDCEDSLTLGAEGHAGAPTVVPAVIPPDHFTQVSITTDMVGDGTLRMTHHTLWISVADDIPTVRIDEAPPQEERRAFAGWLPHPNWAGPNWP